jgi:hypothetical protein
MISVTLSLAEEMLYTTVKISGFNGTAPIGTGTGFFWLVDDGEKKAVLLATNRHVIANCDRLEVMCHVSSKTDTASPSGASSLISLAINPSTVLMHPDSNVDLCVVTFGEAMNQAEKAGTPLFLHTLSAQIVPTPDQWADFDAIEDVLMVGCPRGIYDEANNHPIVRRGITATAMGKDYNNKPEFMVDMACFPGSSGSPVFINQLGYTERKTGNYMMDRRRFFFVGILYSGPLITNKGEIKLGGLPTVEVAAMMHLGQVIRSSMMLAFDDLIRPKIVL